MPNVDIWTIHEMTFIIPVLCVVVGSFNLRSSLATKNAARLTCVVQGSGLTAQGKGSGFRVRSCRRPREEWGFRVRGVFKGLARRASHWLIRTSTSRCAYNPRSCHPPLRHRHRTFAYDNVDRDGGRSNLMWLTLIAQPDDYCMPLARLRHGESASTMG